MTSDVAYLQSGSGRMSRFNLPKFLVPNRVELDRYVSGTESRVGILYKRIPHDIVSMPNLGGDQRFPDQATLKLRKRWINKTISFKIRTPVL